MWRKKSGGASNGMLALFKALEKPKQRLERIVTGLTLDKLTLRESLDLQTQDPEL